MLTDHDVVLLERPGAPEGLRLATRVGLPEASHREPSAHTFLLVHGLSSNSRTWDGVARELVTAGHPVVAVDQRGHGRSAAPPSGYDTLTCADDLAALIEGGQLARLTGASDASDPSRVPVVVGQSWGGNVALALAARRPDLVAALGCVDGGWLRLADRFATETEAWAELAPPVFDGLRFSALAARIRAGHLDWSDEGIEGTLANLIELPDGGVRARLSREHHRAILGSMMAIDPAEHYPLVTAPTLLLPTALGAPSRGGTDGVQQAAAALADAQVRAYRGADHDIHVQQPKVVAAELLALARRVRS